MIKRISLGLVVTLALAGCGASDESSSNSGVAPAYSINDFSAVENSNSLEGTWVYVANGSENEIYSDYSEEGSFSIKNFHIITATTSGFQVSDCESGYEDLSVSGDSIELPFNSSPYVIENNNKISGTFDKTYNDGSYNKFSFDLIKISNSTGSLGTIQTNWSGSATSEDTTEDLIAVCANSISKIDSDGDRSVYSEYEFGVEPYNLGTDITKGHWYGDSVLDLYASGNRDTISENTYWGDSVSISYTETLTTFTGSFSTTTSTGKSVSVSVNAQIQ